MASTGSLDGTFLAPYDEPAGQCDPWEQDCPEGQKCNWWADDGGSSWNATKCVPVVEDPKQLDEPCFAPDGGVGGVDDCDFGLFCWDVDAEGEGYCIELCKGAPDDPYCEDPDAICAVYSEGFGLCLYMCDPILQDCHDASDECIGNPTGEGFLCVTDASGDEGQAHDPCMYANACDPGLICNDPSAAVECDQDATGCCEPFCDLNDPDADETCPGTGQVCNPFFEEGTAPPGYEHVGFCAVPM